MPDTEPDAFTFTDIYGALLGRDYISNEITVSGIDTAADISITGGTYSINGGDFTSDAGTVVDGDTVRVKGTASSDWGTTVDVVLTIDVASDTFSIMTMGAPFVSTGSGTGGTPYVLTKDSWIW